MKKLNSISKKAFSLFEVILALIAISGIMYLFFNMKRKNDFYESINNFAQKIDLIIKEAVTNPVEGYINGKGGYCSSDTSYAGLTAGRAIKCVGWNTNIFPISGASINASSASPSKEYIYGLLKGETSKGGCKVYLKPDNNDLTEFYLFIDCSNLNYSNDNRDKALFESKMIYNLKNAFPNMLQEIYPDAISIDTIGSDNSGTKSDGKIGFKFKN